MKVTEYFLNGNSCSESIILGAIDKGWCDSSLLPVATSFSGGISSGCLCGAVSASNLVIGYSYGKNNKFNNPILARELSKQFMTEFTAIHKATCCRVLSRGTEPGTIERKHHCSAFVEFCFNNLEKILTETNDKVLNG